MATNYKTEINIARHSGEVAWLCDPARNEHEGSSSICDSHLRIVYPGRTTVIDGAYHTPTDSILVSKTLLITRCVVFSRGAAYNVHQNGKSVGCSGCEQTHHHLTTGRGGIL